MLVGAGANTAEERISKLEAEAERLRVKVEQLRDIAHVAVLHVKNERGEPQFSYHSHSEGAARTS